ncbi:MAG TPA: ArsB/NhaD family transporter [Kofleriaceae bacterium]|nr:ArsB/NhaD family transporter [Kofleriaceae bacterium]
MQQLAVYSTLAMTVGLVAVRPSWGARTLSPALVAAAAVLLCALFGAVGAGEVAAAAVAVWRALVTIASLMVTTEVAHRVGLLGWAAARVEARARGARGLFVAVFLLGLAAATALNNDAAIILMTPLVLALVARVYPGRPELALPFATAVFASAGVAPLVVSNPMNAIAADMAGIDFLPYAARMAPVAAVVAGVTLVTLLIVFRRALASAPVLSREAASPTPLASAAQRRVLGVIGGALVAYAAVGWAGGPVWAAAAVGAVAALAVAGDALGDRRARLAVRAVSWETLGFLVGILILVGGLRQVGFIDLLAGTYRDAGAAQVGVTATLGSAVLNNHPMAVVNVMALDAVAAPPAHVFAALVGGDLGPRLLPCGSLAGLLWLELLRRNGVRVSLRRFVGVDMAITAPALAAALLVLALLSW